MSGCTITSTRLDTLAGLALEVVFDGRRLTSDGGLVRIAEADKRLGFMRRDRGAHPGEEAGAGQA
jgi:hypothetical protein